MSLEILLIEDNSNNRYLFDYLLRSRGHRVLAAQDGREGLAMALAKVPELVLLDIQLPVMNGYEVAQALRKHPVLDRTVIVAVTSYAMTGDREKAISSGCDGYIEKPIDPETFVDEVERLVHAHKERSR